MTATFGIGMFFYGMTCIVISAIITYYIINKYEERFRVLAKTNDLLHGKSLHKFTTLVRGLLTLTGSP